MEHYLLFKDQLNRSKATCSFKQRYEIGPRYNSICNTYQTWEGLSVNTAESPCLVLLEPNHPHPNDSEAVHQQGIHDLNVTPVVTFDLG